MSNLFWIHQDLNTEKPTSDEEAKAMDGRVFKEFYELAEKAKALGGTASWHGTNSSLGHWQTKLVLIWVYNFARFGFPTQEAADNFQANIT